MSSDSRRDAEQRKYTVDEIDDLRASLNSRYPNARNLEEIVRTHMLAGHTAQDINPQYPPRVRCSECGATTLHLSAHLKAFHKLKAQ